MSEKIEKLKDFLCENYDNIIYLEGGGEFFELPKFELYPRDYLKFAEQSLEHGDTLGLINCVSNLKRAMDCEIDMFFYTVNLYNVVKDRNLKIGQKLNFIESIGLFSSRSLDKLNHIRNKMEHNYQVPKINEIDLYFELVEALVRALETTISIMYWHRELVFTVYDERRETELGYFEISYKCNNKYPYIKVEWNLRNRKEKIEVNIKNEIKEFIYYFRIFFLLYKIDSIGSKKYVLERIKANV